MDTVSESKQLLQTLETRQKIGRVCHGNIEDWTDTILSEVYTRAISDSKQTLSTTVTSKCKADKKELMIPSLPDLGTFLKPTPEKAVGCCSPSHFGRGDTLVYDETVRKSVEHKFETVEDVHPCIFSVANMAAVQQFGPRIKLTVDKLVIYSPGGLFGKHRDSIKSADHIGTVVVQLPIDCEGGELQLDGVSQTHAVALNDEDSEYMYDSDDGWTSYENAKRRQLVATAFYTDVPHCVAPVRSGHRVSVTFRVENSEIPVKLASWEIHVEEQTRPIDVSSAKGNDAFNEMINASNEDVSLQKFLDMLEVANRSPVVIGCRHMIPRAAMTLEGLRGVDKSVAQKLIAKGYRVSVVLVKVDKIKPDEESERTSIYVCDLPPPKPTDACAVFIRPTENYEAVVVEAGQRYMQHVGNEPAHVQALKYVSAALLVQLKEELS